MVGVTHLLCIRSLNHFPGFAASIGELVAAWRASACRAGFNPPFVRLHPNHSPGFAASIGELVAA